jgi:adenosine deaminase
MLRRNGVKLSLSSDDPAVFNTSLTWQWRIALKKMGWNEDDVFAIMEDAIEASFAPELDKEKLRKQLTATIHHYPNPNFRDRVHYD